MEKPTKRSVKGPEILYHNANTVRLDDSTQRELRTIALYERKKPHELLRDFIVDRVQKYLRTPQYLKFKKQLEENGNKRRDE